MDSPVVSHLFRQLFRHQATRSLSYSQPLRARRSLQPCSCGHQQSRYASRKLGSRRKKEDEDDTIWRHRIDHFPKDMSQELRDYPLVTAVELRNRRERPRRVKMLTRDFIEDSLYNPHYGYFSKHATIFSPGEPFDFNNIEDGPTFNKLLDQRYVEFEDKLDETNYDETRQLWHTPTELFRPYYGEAIARYLVTNYKLTLFPYHDLIIYEMGAGNGTMMLNILDYIRDVEPEVYQRTKYKIIEISSSLANLQQQNLNHSIHAGGHGGHAEIINRSIFDWNTYVHSPCFFLALEVFDNFGHDVIRYDMETGQPRQGCVLIDSDGEFYEYYVPDLDRSAARFLRVRQAAARRPFTTPLGPRLWRKLQTALPFAPNMTLPEYIPTRLMQFYDVLHDYFPAHRLIASDFNSLPDAVPGFNAPVVQTRYQRRNVQATTPYVHQGYFDIFFPTDFNVMEDVYRVITGKLTRLTGHDDFMRRWAYLEDTQTKNGENPLLGWYKNASVMITV
ncbi:Protein arginine methyltransferase NDUFAF7 [Trichophyton interdigitale]|uniref:Protein arginine methyltransferase NDUFAF7 n=1 Tax=Trichophyton interdigitale TaxID=101480 RepID=A0A9P5CZY1_9EURO|nr:Protein arginine methyltransferase NDUFAF7 [Trichophyton interdigitale]KAF3900955.1 Protein arginine methyltransferase NDUFAF7 [Trichophyton interdigitale]KAG8212572.1 Protein arginine methyltransferase NDUFAF7 [Trichophyton interdigitale]